MKHLFNDISKSEKERILEMHGTKKTLNEQPTDLKDVFQSVEMCARKNNLSMPESCQRLKSNTNIPDMNPNALKDCITKLAEQSNPVGNDFVKCVKNNSGFDFTKINLDDFMNKGIDKLKDMFGGLGGRKPWDEKF